MTYVVNGIFFLASDYTWFMGARRYFAMDVRIFPQIGLAFHCIDLRNYLYELINFSISLYCLIESLIQLCDAPRVFFPPFIMVTF